MNENISNHGWTAFVSSDFLSTNEYAASYLYVKSVLSFASCAHDILSCIFPFLGHALIVS